MPLLSEGQIIRDTYEVERFLGEGAFAEVYRVKHRFLGRQAMKVFKGRDMSLQEIEDMLGEAIMLSQIGHPNIIRVFDANILEADHVTLGYFTMENVTGGCLNRFRQTYGNRLIPVETSVELVKQICNGLKVAHLQDPPVIHRDIKPQNVLVGREGDRVRLRVSDFGLAKKVNPLTLLATSAGTPVFKAPEALAATKGDSCAADVWGIGVTLYLMLTDELPFAVPDELRWGRIDHLQVPIRPASEINPDVNPQLDNIISRALAFDPENRHKNAAALLDELEDWKPGFPNYGQPTGKMTESPLKSREEYLSHAADLLAAGRLRDAADLMEEGFQYWPDLREKHAARANLWRKGISM